MKIQGVIRNIFTKYNKNLRTVSAVKTSQYGRSMIEMLGVLAIVGVLSVGGIAGYSKAMEMFKINKFKSQFSNLLAGAVIVKERLGNEFTGETIGTDVFQALGMIPEDMEVKNGYVYDSLGNSFYIKYRQFTYENSDGGQSLEKQYSIDIILDTNSSGFVSSIDKSVCQSVVEISQQYFSQIYGIFRMVSSSGGNQGLRAVNPKYKWSDNDYILPDMTMADIGKFCSQEMIDGYYYMKVIIYAEVNKI